MKVDFLGIGVQKGASTWVYKILEDHHQVIMSFPKELNYFSCEENFQKGNAWYHSFFNKEKSKKTIYGEISPSYFNFYDAPERAYQYNSNLKIIVTLRDPVERAYSNHLHVIRRNEKKYKTSDRSFETALQKYTEMSGGNPQYLDQCKYYTHLKRWFSFFPKESVLVLIKEEIEDSPDLAASKVYRFLGIESNFVSKNLYNKANVSHVVKYKSLEFFLRQSSSMAIKLGLRNMVKNIKNNALVIKFREGGKAHLIEEIPPMKEETKVLLMKEFAPEMLALVDLLGVQSLPWESWRYANEQKVKHE